MKKLLVMAVLLVAPMMFFGISVEKSAAMAPFTASVSEAEYEWSANRESFSSIYLEQAENCESGGVFRSRTKNVQLSGPTALLVASELSTGSQMENVESMFNYVANMPYLRYSEWRNTEDILKTMNGDCADKSVALVSLLKGAGFESYVVYGDEIDGYSHAWVSVNIDGYWLQLDATTNDMFSIYKCIEEGCDFSSHYKIVGFFDNSESYYCS